MPSQSISYFFVRYFDKNKKKWIKTRYRMPRETAAERFADTQYELLEDTKEERPAEPLQPHSTPPR